MEEHSAQWKAAHAHQHAVGGSWARITPSTVVSTRIHADRPGGPVKDPPRAAPAPQIEWNKAKEGKEWKDWKDHRKEHGHTSGQSRTHAARSVQDQAARAQRR